ncbi:hypothetical protein [Yersinia bercovieri]|uniref:hypothetical protein n=1 Tax=Yersinia bercovieri TaxID=634 RepID=UPI0005E49A66|nr:hypothetical protein [Yersinia bercovieri]CFQ33102.1 Uncharacterised protein [Yersinia bercovieri]
MKVVAALSIATITLGGLALAAAALLGPMLALRLGFSLLAGNGGLGALLPKFSGLSGGISRLVPNLLRVSPALLSWRTSASVAGSALGGLQSKMALLGSNAQMALSAAQPGLLARMQQSASDMLARTREMIAPNDFDSLSLAGDIPQLARKPLNAQRNSGPITHEGDRYDITINLQGQQAANIDENKLVNMLYDKIATLQRQKESRLRSTFTDREQ